MYIINIYAIGHIKLITIVKNISQKLSFAIQVVEFLHPEEFSAHISHKVTNAYNAGVVICDLSVSKNRFLSLFEGFSETHTDGFLKFIFVDVFLDPSEVSSLINRGVSSIFSKDFTEKQLEDAIRLGINQSLEKKQQVVKGITAIARFGNLTSREISILSLMLNGYTNKEIATKLGNSSRTIEIHRASIFEKMNVKNAIELALMLND